MLSSCRQQGEPKTISSPNGALKIQFQLTENGAPQYRVTFKDKEVIAPSGMAFDFRNAADFTQNFAIESFKEETINETYTLPWGERESVVNKANRATVVLKEKETGRSLQITFHAADDGFAFRYTIGAMEGIDTLVIDDELTQFAMVEDATTFWQPGDWDIYEHLYNTTAISQIDAFSKRNHPSLNSTTIPFNAVNTPVTLRLSDGTHLSLHEAALVNYSDMTLMVDKEKLIFTSELVGRADEAKAAVTLPFTTPWRMGIVTDNAPALIESTLMLSLNEPNKLGDVPYVEPMKYVGIWWEMHLGVSTWDMYGSQDMTSYSKDVKPTGKHGATTANAKRYIDFASKNGIRGLLVEGWNTGWEHWIGFDDREGVFDFVTPYEDYDLQEVVRYAKEKGVAMIMHHETSAAPRTYDQQMDTAYALMQSLDIHAVKTGYVGPVIPKGEYRHGQWMVNHYQRSVEKAAGYQIAVNIHEPIKGTGLRRTYPNLIAREGVRGQEFNAWSADGGNPPEHLPIVAFTRMLSGPIDFTPGVFNIKLEPYKTDNQVNTTLAQQLALYVVIYSPIQMACDLPQHYEGQPAFQFIRDVEVDWKQTKVLAGEVGDFVTIAREGKSTGNWFVGSITDENARDITIDFSFLPEGVEFEAAIYADAAEAHWDENPTAIEISKQTISRTDVLDFHLAPGGGVAISLIKRK